MEKKKLTFEEILLIQPELDKIVKFVNDPSRKNYYWYDTWGDVKIDYDLRHLVGHYCGIEEISDHIAYDTFCFKILDMIYDNCKFDEEE